MASGYPALYFRVILLLFLVSLVSGRPVLSATSYPQAIYHIYGRFCALWLDFTQPAQQAFLCGSGAKNEEQESKTVRKLAQVKERVLVSFLARSKPKIPFHGLFLLRNQTETLVSKSKIVLSNIYIDNGIIKIRQIYIASCYT